MVMKISCKFEKASCNIIFVRAVTVKSLYSLRRQRWRNKAKSIVSTGCYPVDTIISCSNLYHKRIWLVKQEESARERALCQLTECF